MLYDAVAFESKVVFAPAVAKFPFQGSNCRINAPHSHPLD